MKFHFSHRLWFSLARLPFRRRRTAIPPVNAPVAGQCVLRDVPAGRCAMGHMGCEMIALFNALYFLGKARPLAHIIETYERRRWLLLGGRWGADPYAIGDYAAEEGLPCVSFRGKKQFESFVRAVQQGEGRVFVLSFWVGDTVFSGAHAVTLVRREGRLLAYNLFNGQTAPLPIGDLSQLLPPERYITGYAFA